jgi:hypothetical protein
VTSSAAPIVLFASEAPALGGWSAYAAGGSRAALALEGGPRGAALRFDFELCGSGAWAIARRELAFELPAHYVASLRLRGEGGPNELQVKLVDADGASVWWWRRRDFVPPRDAVAMALRRAALEPAWGPRSARDPDRAGAVEVAVAAGAGGAGTLWIEDLCIEPRELPAGPPRPRSIRASSAARGHEPERALEPDTSASWRPGPGDPRPWIELDLGTRREWGGAIVDFAGAGAQAWPNARASAAGGAPAPACRVLASDDGARWTLLAEESAGGGGRRWLGAGERESRFVRIELAPGSSGGITHVALAPIELAVSPARHAASLARAALRGLFPRHLLGEGAYWAVVGGDGDERKGLLGEDGALELGAESFSVEPFLYTRGRLLSWSDVEARASLRDGCLPIPSVEWEAAGVRLRITACGAGEPGRSSLVARYEVQNAGAAPSDARLFLAVRPFQVTPAWQSLNLRGALAPIARVAREGARVVVDGAREVVAVSAPDGFGAAHSGELPLALAAGHLPEAERVEDPLGFAEGALAFDLRLAPGASEAIVLAAPLFEETPRPPAALAGADAAAWGAARLEEAAARWRARLARVPIELPRCAAPFEESLRASLAWILVNREGPRIQPGPRAYRRSWIRDGAITAAALAGMGFGEEARAFLRWYAGFQRADGTVPCAVDRRGVDPAVEHDSHGELAWGIVEVYRLTGDLVFLRELWPHVARAADAIAALRGERTSEAVRADARFGLLPESISHEGYASQPVHSYFDDFFAVRGLADAAFGAEVLGEEAAAARIGALRDAMRADLYASIARTMERHAIDYLPGSVELGDFDPTSTAIAIDPAGEGERLPRAALEATFARYRAELEARMRGEAAADAYTPYEVRNAAAFLHLGWKERALELLAWLIADQRPGGWRQWPEVATRDPRAPRFLGDLPHGWVASSFVRALRRLLAFEREDGTLVVAAGVPERWVREAPGVRLRGLPTHFGPLELELWAERGDCLRARLGGAARPPGGIVLESPLARPLREVVVGGRARAASDPRRVRLAHLPAEVELRT